jgi:hypothetical protein
MARVHGAEMKRRSSHELSGLDTTSPPTKAIHADKTEWSICSVIPCQRRELTWRSEINSASRPCKWALGVARPCRARPPHDPERRMRDPPACVQIAERGYTVALAARRCRETWTPSYCLATRTRLLQRPVGWSLVFRDLANVTRCSRDRSIIRNQFASRACFSSLFPLGVGVRLRFLTRTHDILNHHRRDAREHGLSRRG